MPYILNSDADRKAMLEAIGVQNFEELLQNIPQECCLKTPLTLGDGMSELELTAHMKEMARKNKTTCNHISFLGGGVYDHYIPAAVHHITGKPEFFTAYTPYQAEVSQGTLQAIYEFQTIICELTGMDIANASMYDGSSAAAEAALMACAATRRSKIVLAGALHPSIHKITGTYTQATHHEIVTIAPENGVVPLAKLDAAIDDDVACVVIQSPNFLGIIEDLEALEKTIHQHPKMAFIVHTDLHSTMLFKSPGEMGADIVIGEGQPTGIAQGFGGPLLGFLACQDSFKRLMPGRIVGMTEDTEGKHGYVLTLQAREQHIRREKATSNICTNQALCMLASLTYMCLMGQQGMRKVAELCTQKAHWLAEKIQAIPGFQLAYDKPFFKEFAIIPPVAPQVLIDRAEEKGILAGIDLEWAEYPNQLLIAVTEKRSEAELQKFIDFLQEFAV